MSGADTVAGLIALNGGRLVGKTRLQKTVYLLQQCGLDSNFEFEYHNFGPFSSELAECTKEAKIDGLIDISESQGFHGVPYSTFTAKIDPPREFLNMSAADVQKLLRMMEGFSAIEMELAATIAFLNDCGVASADINASVRELKPLKSTGERLDSAHALLEQLGLE